MGSPFVINIETKLQKIMERPDLKPDLEKVVSKAALIALRAYAQEIPVDKGLAKSYITIQGAGLEKRITTTVTNRGFRYPIAVHQGTGRWAGSSSDFPSHGRRREGVSFAGSGGIPPNKFAKRAKDKSEPFVHAFFVKEINRLSST